MTWEIVVVVLLYAEEEWLALAERALGGDH